MKIRLRLVYADGDVAVTLLRPWRWSYAFVALLYPFYLESEIPIRFNYDKGASTALLLRFYCALAVSATIRVILTKISNRSGIAVHWNCCKLSIKGCVIRKLKKDVYSLQTEYKRVCHSQAQ